MHGIIAGKKFLFQVFLERNMIYIYIVLYIKNIVEFLKSFVSHLFYSIFACIKYYYNSVSLITKILNVLRYDTEIATFLSGENLGGKSSEKIRRVSLILVILKFNANKKIYNGMDRQFFIVIPPIYMYLDSKRNDWKGEARGHSSKSGEESAELFLSFDASSAGISTMESRSSSHQRFCITMCFVYKIDPHRGPPPRTSPPPPPPPILLARFQRIPHPDGGGDVFTTDPPRNAVRAASSVSLTDDATRRDR